VQAEGRTKKAGLFFIPSAAYLRLSRIKDSASRGKNKKSLKIICFKNIFIALYQKKR